MNNFVKAFKIRNTGSISEEKLTNHQKYFLLDLYSDKFAYFTVSYNGISDFLKIIKSSNKCHILTEYSYADF